MKLYFAVILCFALTAAAQDPGEPVDTYKLDEDFQYRIDEGDWVTVTPSYVEEKVEGFPSEHWWVQDLGRKPVMSFFAFFDDDKKDRGLEWGIDTSSSPILKDVPHQLFYVRWRKRNYPDTPYEIVGPWSESSDYVRVVKIRRSGRVIAIKPR